MEEAADGQRALDILRGAMSRMAMPLNPRMPRLGENAVLEETVAPEDHAPSEHGYVPTCLRAYVLAGDGGRAQQHADMRGAATERKLSARAYTAVTCGSPPEAGGRG